MRRTHWTESVSRITSLMKEINRTLAHTRPPMRERFEWRYDRTTRHVYVHDTREDNMLLDAATLSYSETYLKGVVRGLWLQKYAKGSRHE